MHEKKKQKISAAPHKTSYVDEPHNKSSQNGCLAANAFWSLPISKDQPYSVKAVVAGNCDSRGWSWDGGGNWVTPAGAAPGNQIAGTLTPAPLGTLVGAFSTVPPPGTGGLVAWPELIQIFSLYPISIGAQKAGTACIDGWLYLMMNDNGTLGDDVGSAQVEVVIG